MSPKKNQKKAITFGIIIASLIALIITVPVGLMYALFYDPNSKIVEVPEDTNYNVLFADTISKSLDKVNEDKTVTLSASKEQVNEALTIIKTRKYEFSRYATNLEYDFDNSLILIDIQVPLFKTRLIINVDPYFDLEKQELVIPIKDFKIGRMKTIMPLAKKLADNENIMEALLWLFQSMSLNMHYDEATMSFVYPLENIVYDLYDTSVSDDSSLMAALLAQSVVDKKANIIAEEKKVVTSIDGYQDKNEYEIDSLRTNWQIEDALKNYLSLMIKDKLFQTINNDEQNEMFRFLLLGYENLSEDEQKKIKEYDLTKYGIEEVKEFEGLGETIFDDKINIPELFVEEIEKEITDHKDDFEDGYTISLALDETDFHNGLLTSPLVLTGACPSSLDGEDIHFGIMDNCYLNFVEDGFALVNQYNLDHNITTYSGLFTTEEKDGNVYKFTLKDVALSTSEPSKYVSTSYLSFLKNKLYNSGNWMWFEINSKEDLNKVKKEDCKMVFDFDTIIKETTLKKVLDSKDLTYKTHLTLDEDNFIFDIVLKG